MQLLCRCDNCLLLAMVLNIDDIILRSNETTEDNYSLVPAYNRKPILHQKPFIWDNVIYVIASSIFGLSVSGVIIDFFNSDKYSVVCFSPFESRSQYMYVNGYCNKYIPIQEYFAVALMLHAAALVAPHYIWRVQFSAQIDCFFRHVSRIETLRDRDTGKYPPNNYNIVNNLQREFSDKKTILKSYIAKLVLQFLVILISFATNWYIFGNIDSNITFDCYDDDEINQSFGNVTCAFPRKLFINVLQVTDYCLLVVAVMILTCGLLWTFLYNHSIEDDKIAEFCYNSGIDPKYYYYKPLKKWLKWCRMENDFMFLLASLLATDTAVRRVFKAILIEDTIFEKFSTQLAPSKKKAQKSIAKGRAR